MYWEPHAIAHRYPHHAAGPRMSGRIVDQHGRYRERADALPGLVMCGRLGEYRYYDMDQAIGRALTLVKRALSSSLPQGEG